MRTLNTLLAILAASLAVSTARAASVTVTVSGITTTKGMVLVGICPRAVFLQPHCPWHGSAPAQPGSVRIVIKDVPPGTYAAESYQDENGNKKLDRNFFGWPTEPLGFSNNAPLHMGPPSFDAAAFTLGAGDLAITFALVRH